MTRPTQMRRHARRMRRYGLQPMIVIGGDSLPDVAALVIARLVWRYRSELAPAAVAAMTALTAELLHLTHPGTWWIIPTAAALAAAGLPIARRRLGFSTPPARTSAPARTRKRGAPAAT